MDRTVVDAVESDALGAGVERRTLTGPLDATDLAVNHYRIPPGEGLPSGLHAHTDQEEVFVVLAGEATFETLASGVGERGRGEDDSESDSRRAEEAITVTVGAGEAVRFAPGEFQTGRNAGDDDLAVLALGAPRDSDDVRLPAACRDCGRGDVRLEVGADGVAFVCPDCGSASTPVPCPECGDEDLRMVAAGRDRTAARCSGCGATFDEPPLVG